MKSLLQIAGIFIGLFMVLHGYGQIKESVAQAQIPSDVPRCHTHKNAHDIIECRMPGATCFFIERVSGTAMSCLER